MLAAAAGAGLIQLQGCLLAETRDWARALCGFDVVSLAERPDIVHSTLACLLKTSEDRMFMDELVNEPEALTRYSIAEIVEAAGTEGVELIMWLAMRGALGKDAPMIHSHYHIPISDTAAGLMVFENGR